MPIVARDLLGGDATTFGILLGGFGVGAMLGALSSATLRHRFSSDTLLRILSALACVAMIGIGQSRWGAVTLLAHVIAGSVWTLAFANFNIACSCRRRVGDRTHAGGLPERSRSRAWARQLVVGEFRQRLGLREALTTAGVASCFRWRCHAGLAIAMEQLGSLDPRARVELTRPVSNSFRLGADRVVISIACRRNADRFASRHQRGRPDPTTRRRSRLVDLPGHRRHDSGSSGSKSTWLDYLRWRTRRPSGPGRRERSRGWSSASTAACGASSSATGWHPLGARKLGDRRLERRARRARPLVRPTARPAARFDASIRLIENIDFLVGTRMRHIARRLMHSFAHSESYSCLTRRHVWRRCLRSSLHLQAWRRSTSSARSGGRRNVDRDWWPERLDLSPLRQHSPPPTRWRRFNYAEEFKKLTSRPSRPTQGADDFLAAVVALPTTPLRPFFIRMAGTAGTLPRVRRRAAPTAHQIAFEPLNSWPTMVNLDKAKRLLWADKAEVRPADLLGDLMV